MKPLLAATTDGTGLTYPLLASFKLDGVRALIVNGVVMSRNLKPIPNQFVQRLFGKKELNGLDGELVVGPPNAKTVFNTTSSAVMSVEGEPDVVFYVFDTHSMPEAEFHARLSYVEKRFKRAPTGIVFLPQMRVQDEISLVQFEADTLKLGYEGVMLRDPAGIYKHGRSTLKEGILMKLKRFADGEAELIGMAPLYKNANPAKRDELGYLKRSSHKAHKIPTDRMGSLLVRDLKTKVEFEIGTGFTEDQRIQLWAERLALTGRIVKYKYQTVGIVDKPRFPVFLGFRDPIDL